MAFSKASRAPSSIWSPVYTDYYTCMYLCVVTSCVFVRYMCLSYQLAISESPRSHYSCPHTPSQKYRIAAAMLVNDPKVNNNALDLGWSCQLCINNIPNAKLEHGPQSYRVPAISPQLTLPFLPCKDSLNFRNAHLLKRENRSVHWKTRNGSLAPQQHHKCNFMGLHVQRWGNPL
jgi:hypothetical protein